MTDKGAHFHCCDLQVHTPRDSQWDGPVPATGEERQQFAADLIQACRHKGLDAIAITDHHDFAYFQYLKSAAENELDDEGNPVHSEERITVFPGMELTLAVPCQALLILDADYPVTMLPTVYTALALEIPDHDQPQCPQAQPLNSITLLSELYKRLDEHTHLCGKYIILPHVSDGGHKTLLRSNFQAKYIEMPCVGGYLDGSVERMGQGVKRITDGKDRNYGFKKVGIFQTSDNRRADFSDLGKYTTWVKWSKPTAEALRQACLARDTRISHAEPELPAVWIRSIEVNQSRFMGPISIDLNRQMNCLIGGRGTGKSTILEYVRWTLCDQPPAFSHDDELPDFQAKRAALIDNTLVPLDAVATITLEKNGVLHAVRRRSHDGRVFLKIADGEFEERSEEDIRTLLPLQAYSQKQLSAVGVRTDELLRFIHSPVQQQLDEFRAKEAEIKTKLRKHYGAVRAKRELSRQIEREELELGSLSKQEKALRGQLKGLDEEDQQVLKMHDAFVAEGEAITTWKQNLGQVREGIATALNDVARLPSHPEIAAETPNHATLEALDHEMTLFVEEIRKRLTTLAEAAGESSPLLTRINELMSGWGNANDEHQKRYEAAKQKASSQQKLLAQIQEVENRAKVIRDSLNSKKSALSKHGDPESLYADTETQWASLYRQRADLLQSKCDELTQLSGQRIRAVLKRGSGVDEAQRKLETLISGTRIRIKKVEDLFSTISNADDPIAIWKQSLSEMEALASIASDETEISLPSTPVLSAADFTQNDLAKIARKLTSDDWLDLSLAELRDVPVFEYEQREGEYIPFAAASAGQQATALLRVLLNQDGPPLMIDQPEEDLDNQVVLKIVEETWSAKGKRQLIFSSHNANIVVNGDADLVVCCDYRRAGDQSGGQIKCEGAIDIAEIRKEITEVMEGGHTAFRLRKEKYGF